MYWYYGMVVLSTLMFGVQFYCNDRYRQKSGSGAASVFLFNLIGALTGVVCLAPLNRFDFSATPFTLIWAAITALNAILCSFCTLKALERVNLSVYSLFSMLGGMMLPFLAGLLFYGEEMTLAKAVCVALILFALLLGVKSSRGNGGTVYYVGVFLLNGMSGVLSKIYEDTSLEKVSATGYSLWSAIASALFTATVLLILQKQVKKPCHEALFWSVGAGLLNRVANLILLLALALLPASVQYPMVTGGVMIASTALALLTGQRVSKKEILAVMLSFVGILALVLIPI